MESNGDAEAAVSPPEDGCPPHPQGVQPWGNFLMNGGENIRLTGLGAMSCLSDDLLVDVLGRLTARELARFSQVSRACFCFACYEDLWKALVLEQLQGEFDFQGSWRATFAAHSTAAGQRPQKRARMPAGAADRVADDGWKPPGGCVTVGGFYSDLLYQPWLCAHQEMLPEWLDAESIERRSGLAPKEFLRDYAAENRPVIITDCATAWPAMDRWTQEYLESMFEGRRVIAGEYEMDFARYRRYCERQVDELPLYLFDKKFADSASGLAQDYVVPEVFQEDLFAVLGEERPDFRWLIIGPKRSGSSWHQDPNATSAWNAVVSGSKKWIMYPPHITPPGVYPSADGASVACPVSLMEWMRSFYHFTRRADDSAGQADAQAEGYPLEAVVRPGEVLYVPRGWWHMAINLEYTVAVTQNFVARSDLPHVLHFLRTGSKELVSGCAVEQRASLHQRFLDALHTKQPDALQTVEEQQRCRQASRLQASRLAALFQHGAPSVAAPSLPLATPPAAESSSPGCELPSATPSAPSPRRDAAPPLEPHPPRGSHATAPFKFGFAVSGSGGDS